MLTVVRVLFADPWPEGLVSSLLSTVNRCARCTPGQSAAASGAAIDADMALELAAAMAVAAPSRVSREQMQAMLDAAPGWVWVVETYTDDRVDPGVDPVVDPGEKICE